MNAGKLNPFIDFINTVFNFIVLNMVFMVTCLPVFTIGTAVASLYYVIIKESRGEYGYLVRTYFREFRRNFKTGTVSFLILFAIGALLVFNLLFWPFKGNPLSAAVTGLLIALAVVWLVIFHYTFPLIGRFVNTPLRTIKNAWGLALRNLKGTFALLAIDAAAICVLLFIPLSAALMILSTFGFVFTAYCRCRVLNKIFLPYEKESEGTAGRRQSILREHADMMAGTSQY